MYPTSPEDRLLQVRRLQDEQRHQMATERMVKAAVSEGTTEAARADNGASSGSRVLLETTTHVLRAITRPHAVAHHRAR